MMRKILILPRNFRKMGDLQPKLLYFWNKIFRQEENFLTG